MIYTKLLSPLMINNVVLKNRMSAANALPHFLQGPEVFPNDAIIEHLAGIARNGAAFVTFADWTNPVRSFGNGDICHFPVYDISDPSTENYMNQLTDAIHFYGSKASISVQVTAPQGYGVYTTQGETGGPVVPEKPPVKENDLPSAPQSKAPPIQPFRSGPEQAITEELMEDVIQKTIERIRYYKNCGFDMCTLHMAYRATLLSKFLSPLTNKRTDEYGGSMENRAKFPLRLCAAIKEAFGKDFLIEAQVSGEDGKPGGNTTDDLVEFAHLAEGVIDILQIRAGNADDAHPTGFNSVKTEPMTLRYAEAVKKSGAKIIAEPIGGFQNPDDMERYLAEGKADMFGMARSYICDFEYGKKIEEGRGEDITPCIRCNRCHGLHMKGPWLTVCSVNPRMGIEHRLDKMVAPADRSKRVIVIGGGPAGMVAAITAYDRGHKVTLYEKSGILGGQLWHADYVSFKWPLRDYKDHLIAQLRKRDIEVRMNTSPTAEELKELNADVIIAALGAKPVIPPIAGALDENGALAEGIWNPLQVYGHEDELGRKVVIVGGADIGTETGMHLADKGIDVTVLTRQNQLASASDRVHFYSMMKNYWESQENFHAVTFARTTKVSADKVWYEDKDGVVQEIMCDSVIVCGGMAGVTDEALSYVGCAPVVRLVGDNEKPGNVQSAVRSAYAAASSI